MDVEITKLSGESFRLSEYDVYARDFIVESIEVIPNYSAVDGRNGRVDNGATYGGRGISVPFLYKAADMHGVALLRDELRDRKSTRLNSSHVAISYAVFCLKRKR